MTQIDLENAVGRAIVAEAWAIEGLPVKALTTGYARLLGRAAINALMRQPDGMVMVPVEPTDEMLEAPNTIIQKYAARLIYQRMIAARPRED